MHVRQIRGIAQKEEQGPSKSWVVGSIPTASTRQEAGSLPASRRTDVPCLRTGINKSLCFVNVPLYHNRNGAPNYRFEEISLP